MQEVHTLMRFLFPPGWVTARTVWMLGSHRRLVRRWECETDLPKPGPFPQISQPAAICRTPRISTWVSPDTGDGSTRQPDQDTGRSEDHQKRIHRRERCAEPCQHVWLGWRPRRQSVDGVALSATFDGGFDVGSAARR